MASQIRAVLADSVRRERKARGWTQAELAVKAGIAKATVMAVETQRTGTTVEVAAMIAEAFGMTAGTLVDGRQEGGRG